MTVQINLSDLKKGGFIKERQADRFAVRLRVPIGVLTSEQLGCLGHVAERYGQGFVHVTTRQGVEISGVRSEDLAAVTSELAKVGLAPGSCGPRIRNIMACPGVESCMHGLVDSRALGKLLDGHFVGKDYPVKVKIAVAGCPNSCTTPQVNDIGFVGAMEPVLDTDLCTGDGLCEIACKEGAITMDDDQPSWDKDKCVFCGDCVAICPTHAWSSGRVGYTVYVGGKVGRHPQLGTRLAEFVSDEESISMVGRILAFLERYGHSGERLGSVLNRTGIETLRAFIAQGGSDG